jgi:spermidine synthase
LPWLTVLFVGSGCAALIYEIVWFQMLQSVIGSSAVSLGVLLGTFMAGMCLGSLLLPRWISSRAHPLRVYAGLEFGIGIIGVAVLFGMPVAGSLYSSHVGHGFAGIVLRGVVAAICLLPPTLLMGATLPAIARSVDTTPRGVSWLAYFYGGNIAGAVWGCLLAGFYLLRVYDLSTATFVAVAINMAAAAFAFILAGRTPHTGARDERDDKIAPQAPGAWRAYSAIALSGASALGAEVIWTRQLALILGGTVYTFSLILAVFLVGLGIGSSLGARLGRTVVNPRVALGVCQILLSAGVAWAAWQMGRSLPYWPVVPALSDNPWFNLQLDLVRCLWAVLPAACLWGASFPLALAAAASPGQDPGRLVGRVYAANTVGAIIGALTFSVVLIGWLGTQQSQRLLILITTFAALMTVCTTEWLRERSPANVVPRQVLPRLRTIATGVGIVALSFWLASTVPPVPGELICNGRNLPSNRGKGIILYQGEGLNSSVAVSMLLDGTRHFHVSGKVEASAEPQDMRLQRMLSHIPALLHQAPRSALVVGCGAGVTAGSFVVHPTIERIVICDIEPLVPGVVATYFRDENYNVVNDKRVRIENDDARHFILTTNETFDIITSDPIHPWMKGAATLYTTEYFELCKRRLNPGGMITQWVPLYESNPDVVKSELATLFSVFPEASVWGNPAAGQGHDVVVLAQNGPLKVNVDQVMMRLDRDDHHDVVSSLAYVGFSSGLDLLATYAGRAADLAPWLTDAQINRDRNLRLQYLAGLGLNSYCEAAIYQDILARRKYSDEIFYASDRRRRELRLRMGLFEP